jgi:hypothetical protein
MKLNVDICLPRSPTNDGTPHVEQTGDKFAYVVTERGEETIRRETRDAQELLSWLVRDCTKQIAVDWERENRKKGIDPRRAVFEKHVEILSSINPDWAGLQKNEYERITSQYPFDDKAIARADRAAELRNLGVPSEKAWERAVVEFP